MKGKIHSSEYWFNVHDSQPSKSLGNDVRHFIALILFLILMPLQNKH